MSHHPKRVAITGAGGQIAYSLIFRIAAGELFGPNQPISLHLLELPAALPFLKGLVMELEDCAFPLLKEIHIGDDPNQVFQGIDFAFLVGAKPRGPGMERKDLLLENAAIFVSQGKALNHASKDAKILVVGNPCNTNCLIAIHHAKNLSPKQFFAMTRLDQNRAASQLAKKAKVSIDQVKKMTIWGNHSTTQVPDFEHAEIHSLPVSKVIHDRKWLETDFFSIVQKRGAEVIAARGKSSAASAANAAIDAMRSIIHATPENDWYSSAIFAEKNPYNIDERIVFSFPCKSNAKGDFEIVKGLNFTEFLQEKINLTQKELLEEREMVAHLLS